MKVLHVPFCYWPDAVGGTEVYVESLAKEQQRQGLRASVAAPGTVEDRYSHNGVNVRRFAVTQEVEDIRELYGDGDPVAAVAFARILEEECPDLVHLHAFTRGASLRVMREAKRRRIPVVFSYHTPTVSCQRGTLLRWGSESCDGTLDIKTCSQCVLHGRGINKTLSGVVGALPVRVGRSIGSGGLTGGLWTAIRTTELVALRHAAFRSLMDEVNQIVAPCQWVKDVLLRNGVPEGKITLSRQGLCEFNDTSVVARRSTERTGSQLRVIFVGRLDATKGVHILIQAFKAAHDLPLQLDIYGIVQGETGRAYCLDVKQEAENDHRIRFRDPIPANEVVGRMRDYDVLAVPSQWLETGPMVVLEAFAAGIPVIGSNIGGIAELVTHGVNGLLVQPELTDAWRRSLESLCCNRRLLSELRAGILPPRRIVDVAIDMSELYSTLFEEVVPA